MVSTKVLACLAFATFTLAACDQTRQSGYADPKTFGGSSLGYFSGNPKGEPLNVIVTGIPAAETFSSWYKAIGKECLGLHVGKSMQAHIDSRGPRNEEGVIRFAYGDDPDGQGSCTESIIGGSHFRYWQQQGTKAWFLAASREKDVDHQHDIVPNGYNLGRDAIVRNATKPWSYKGKKFIATVSYVSGLLPSGSKGINHGIAIDGRTAVLKVTVS
ncbi:unnamed protein product [Tilletia laevis]|uniref:Lipoprotein n=3 Tax=Tilletia TaxID=13289 RepID=A0A8X7MLW4_9BASI|nr:hypothetical protein A4X06_0g7472 [Tilletia controversa]CAD6886811.1 unnamed protein product [Tilletia caries]CAD6912616.1 unnamed protein product [Tilletia laevis]CAD6918258.1 unnamed protein product [Tilletia caries]CAD6923999.1 unnamed protein product [Tilletia caries]